MGAGNAKAKGAVAEAPSQPLEVPEKFYSDWIQNPENMSDLSGKTALITGVSTTAGLGFFVTQALALKGAQCIITCRNKEKGGVVKEALDKALAEAGSSGSVTVMQMDNCDFASIRTFAEDFMKQYGRLDIVVNNAGVMALPVSQTKDGYDVQIQTNHLSHFLMLTLLWPLIKKTAESTDGAVRISQVSSGASEAGYPSIDTTNFNNPHPSHGFLLYLAPFVLGGRAADWARYGQSKLANVVFAQELHRRVAASGLGEKIISVACHPGLASTNLQVTTQKSGNMKDAAGYHQSNGGQAPQDGALPLIMSVAHPSAKGGDYFGPETRRTGPPAKQMNKNPLAYNEKLASALWEASESAVGQKFAV